MKAFSIFLLVFLVALVSRANTSAFPALTSSLGPVINVGYAAFAGNTTSPTGVQNGPVTFFGGIPYAQPPVGGLRFRAPQPLDEIPVVDKQPKVTDARNWGPACIQQPAQVGIGSEGLDNHTYTRSMYILTS